MAGNGHQDSSGEEALPKLSSFAEKLDYLFKHMHPRGRGEYSYREVAGGIERAGGPTISPTYLMYLRKGERTNPSLHHLEAIATFFGVSPAYFLDDEAAERVAQEVRLLAALRDAGVRQVALRASELSTEGLAAITRMVEEVHRREGKQSSKRPPTGRTTPHGDH